MCAAWRMMRESCICRASMHQGTDGCFCISGVIGWKKRLMLSSLSVQGRLKDEGAQQTDDADVQAEPSATQAEPSSKASEADPFGLDQIMQKEDASK